MHSPPQPPIPNRAAKGNVQDGAGIGRPEIPAGAHSASDHPEHPTELPKEPVKPSGPKPGDEPSTPKPS